MAGLATYIPNPSVFNLNLNLDAYNPNMLPNFSSTLNSTIGQGNLSSSQYYSNLSNPQMSVDVTTGLQQAKTSGDTKLANILNYVLTIGDSALGILSKYGIIKNKNLLSQQYGIQVQEPTTTDTTTTKSAVPEPPKTNTGIDLTDPKTLFIIFLLLIVIVGVIVYLAKPNQIQSSTKSK